MNVVYAGYRTWAFQILRKLLKQHNRKWKISGIITTNTSDIDFTSFEVPTVILNNNRLTSRMIKKFKPDVFLFYGWSWILPKEIYKNYPCLILHTSPLPKYRGGSPLQHQIINGEKKSAATIFQADDGLDTGPIYSQTEFSLNGTIHDIFKQLVKIGTKDSIKVLNGMANKSLQPKAQDNSQATIYKRRKPQESELTLKDFKTKTAKQLYDFIRALGDPYPNAYITGKDGKRLYIKEVTLKEKE